ncbi:MAG: polysaccharide deacetylase family protein [Marinirhabdus sp.]|nr:polysaccharide deacetylase family protein [Marinirhabdus sp.]
MLNFKNTTIAYIASFLLLMLASLFFYFSGWIYIWLALSYLGIIAVASFSIRSNFFLKAFSGTRSNNRNKVALTFDDGPHPVFTTQVLSLLKRYDAKATFFCIGKHMETYPEVVQKIKEAGHVIGNHSYSHKNTIAFNGTKCWIQEIEKTDTIINSYGGPKPKLFRPPFGVTTPHLAKAVELTNHRVVGWNIRPFDTSIKQKEAIVKHIKRRVKPGAVILLHDTHDRIPYILEHLLLFLQQNDYELVSVNELM